MRGHHSHPENLRHLREGPSPLGMRQQAHTVRSHLFKAEWSDEIVYAMLADE
jgi:hypothetical protein